LMDGGGGEALLVRRSKPKKRPAPAEPHAEGREFGGGNRFLALWRGYHDLLQVPAPLPFLLLHPIPTPVRVRVAYIAYGEFICSQLS
jgi:hypothetical protein